MRRIIKAGVGLFVRPTDARTTYRARTIAGECVTVSGPYRCYPSGLEYYRVEDEPRFVFAGHVKTVSRNCGIADALRPLTESLRFAS
ncbi:hypothetical protein FHU29_000811 [Hoyosella altamirensis]|uniref:Uncharacterized protein n=1 Tax=Hoyosella altamirensis TaxID=616997 RepID=A0A839RJ05_9ACTN|nr:hypothetical protein [Hoyosella altamirensis]